MTLTPKMQRFIEEYLIDLNATQAAIRAGYSEKTADKIGHENLVKPEIKKALDVAMKERSERTQVTADMVVKELAKIGFSNMRKFASWSKDGVSLIDSETLDEDDAACVQEVSQTITEAGGSIKFKLHDKKSALDSLGKHLGMFVEKIQHTGAIEFTDNRKGIADRFVARQMSSESEDK